LLSSVTVSKRRRAVMSSSAMSVVHIGSRGILEGVRKRRLRQLI
jgi:hypothetical protein